MLVGLLAMLALVLDGGNVYTQRRQAQLAADAGALAGARAHCDPDVTASPESEANNYVMSNDANMISFSLDEDIHEVEVVTEIIFDTFFLHILGRPQLTAEAIAAARCETGSAATKVLPVAWSCRPTAFGDIPDPGCKLDVWDDDGKCTYFDEADEFVNEDVFYLIIDSEDLDDVIYCAEDGTPYGDPEGDWPGFNCTMCGGEEENDDQVTYCNSDYPRCDVNCDGIIDLKILSEGSFGWLDLDGGGSDANELRDWVIAEGDDRPTVSTHYWYAGKTGMATTVFHAVGEYVTGKAAVVPVFDHFCSKEFGLPARDNANCEWHYPVEDPPPAPDEDFVVVSGIADDYFHITGFANFLVTCVNANPWPKDQPYCKYHQELVDAGFMSKTAKSIEGCFIEGVAPEITGYGSDDFSAYTLRLVR
jgi:hypothetical protein